MAWLGKFMIRVVSVLLVSRIVPGFRLETVSAALWAAVAIGLIDFVVKPFLTFLSLPITIMTFGLFSFIVNGISLYLASVLVPGFEIEGFMTAVVAAIVLSVISAILSFFVR